MYIQPANGGLGQVCKVDMKLRVVWYLLRISIGVLKHDNLFTFSSNP